MFNLKENIRVIARERGMSLTQLEVAAGLGNGTIGKWDIYSPRVDRLMAVAEVLDVSVDYILGIKKEPAQRGLAPDFEAAFQALPKDKQLLIMNLVKGISQD